MVQVDDSDGLTYHVSLQHKLSSSVYLQSFVYLVQCDGQTNANTLQFVLQPYLDVHIAGK